MGEKHAKQTHTYKDTHTDQQSCKSWCICLNILCKWMITWMNEYMSKLMNEWIMHLYMAHTCVLCYNILVYQLQFKIHLTTMSLIWFNIYKTKVCVNLFHKQFDGKKHYHYRIGLNWLSDRKRGTFFYFIFCWGCWLGVLSISCSHCLDRVKQCCLFCQAIRIRPLCSEFPRFLPAWVF